jgi:hypothetical protein
LEGDLRIVPTLCQRLEPRGALGVIGYGENTVPQGIGIRGGIGKIQHLSLAGSLGQHRI